MRVTRAETSRWCSGPPAVAWLLRSAVNSGPGPSPRMRSQACRAAGDRDDPAVAVGVGLGAADGQQHSPGLEVEVGEVEGDELGGAQRGGEADQDERGVADPQRCGAIDRAKDLDDVGSREGPGLTGGRDPEHAAQAAAYGADDLVVDGVGQVVGAVGVADGGAGDLDGAEAAALRSPVDEVGGHRFGVGGQHGEVTGGGPAFPQTPGAGVDVQGRRSV